MLTSSLDIVVVNFRSVDLLSSLIESIEARRHVGVRLTIWENGSGGDEVERLKSISAQRPWISLIVSLSNLGFGEAVNRAIDSLRVMPEDLIWILNPDTVIHADAIECLATQLVLGYCDVVSPIILSGASEANMIIWFAGGVLDTRAGSNTHEGMGDSPVSYVDRPPFPTSFMTGAAPMMTYATWKRVGGFRGDLFLYWEDCEWSERAGVLGLRMFVCPGATIWHAEGGSSGVHEGLSRNFYYYSARNRLSSVPSIGLRLNRLLGAGIMVTVRLSARSLFRERSDRFPKFVACLRGSAHGILGRTGSVLFD